GGDALGATGRGGDRLDRAPRVFIDADAGRLVAPLHLRGGDGRERDVAIRVALGGGAQRFVQRLGHLRRRRPGGEEPDHRREFLLAEQQVEALVEDAWVVEGLS